MSDSRSVCFHWVSQRSSSFGSASGCLNALALLFVSPLNFYAVWRVKLQLLIEFMRERRRTGGVFIKGPDRGEHVRCNHSVVC